MQQVGKMVSIKIKLLVLCVVWIGLNLDESKRISSFHQYVDADEQVPQADSFDSNSYPSLLSSTACTQIGSGIAQVIAEP